MSGDERPDASRFAALSRQLMSLDEDADSTAQRIVDRAVETIEPVAWAGITLRRRRGAFESLATSDDRAAKLDALQYDLREGPCLDAATHEGYQLAGDLERERRWPEWRSRAVQLGARSVLAIQLSDAGGKPVGALNLYGVERDWTTQDLDVALVFAVHAANAMVASRLATGLRTAMDSRHEIGMAQGVLLARYGLKAEESFEVLRRLSSTRNVKLHDLAQEIITSGRLPD